MKGTFPVNKFRELETPFYYYDVNVLRETLSCINKEAGKYNNFCVHYAVKANANHKILTIIRENGLGADCVEAQPVKTSAERMTAKRRVCFFVDKRFGFIKEGSFLYSCSTGVCGWPQRTSRLPLRQRSASRNSFSLRSSARRTR